MRKTGMKFIRACIASDLPNNAKDETRRMLKPLFHPLERTTAILDQVKSETISRAKAKETLTSQRYGFTTEQADYLIRDWAGEPEPTPAIFPEI